jgi:phosphate transport system protein
MPADLPQSYKDDPIGPPAGGAPAECFTPHSSHDFDVEMGVLRERLAAMAGRCREQLHVALDAFWSGSKDTMADVEASDRAIDRDERAVDGLVLEILALRQPVASDLRLLTASFKFVTDLERIGDEAVDLARTPLSRSPDGEAARTRLQRMMQATEAVLADALHAFFEADAEGAARVHRTDKEIDAMYDQVFRDAVAFMSQHPTDTASALSFIAVAKCLERIADHAANIAHWAAFVIGRDEEPA